MTERRPALVLALTGLRREGDLVRALSAREAPATIARRVTDVVELLAVCRAGLADGVLVAPRFPGLDRAVVADLRESGVACWAVVEPGDDDGSQLMRDWGVSAEALVGDPAATVRALLARRDPAQAPAGAAPRAPFVVVTGPAGAPGRSTVAVNLAAECSGPALLVDADVVAPSLAFQLGLDPGAGGLLAVARAAQQGALTPRALLAMGQPAHGMRVVPGVPEHARTAELRGSGAAALWPAAAATGLPVVVDAGACPASHPEAVAVQAAAFAAATDIVVVAHATALGIRRLMSGFAELAATTPARLTLVWNAVPTGRDVRTPGRRPLRRLRPVHEALGVAAVAGLPWDPRAAAAVDGRPGPLAACAPRSALREAIRQLAGELIVSGRRTAGLAAPAAAATRSG